MADNTTLPGTGDVIASDDVAGVKYQRIKATWGVDGTATDVAATTPFPTSTNASIFRFSAGNTSASQLAASATFSGTRETALDQPSISLLMTCDQPITLTIKQYIDDTETYAVPPIVYNIPANQGFSGSFGLNGNYVRVTAQNTGTATTTTFNLNTAYGSLPTSDGTGRMPVSKADCVSVLSQAMTATGYSTTMDTNGYGAIVAQISGVWQGNGYFEASNNGVDWDTVLVFSRDSLSLQDIVTSGGLYTVRPSGRYLRFTLTRIVGSMTINAIGRAAEGIAASDLLSLAMDKNNNTPLFTELSDATVAKIAQPAMAQIGYWSGYGVIAVNSVLCVVDCVNYSSVMVQLQVGTSGNVQAQWSNDGAAWSGSTGWYDAVLSSVNAGASTGASQKVSNVFGRYLRLVMGTATIGATITSAVIYGNRSACVQPINTLNTVTSVVTVGNISAINASTGTNSTTAGTIVSAATNNLTQIKATLGRIYSFWATNTTASVQYIKLFALPSASVTMGTTSATQNYAIPPNGTLDLNISAVGLCIGGTGISYAITTGAALTDNTATTAGAVILNYAYA